ncbi:hypothetical protein XIS1_450015 [Xenorhabdus innexi]|uniref:Uncharacterized protein n=1 Tax=Xenorhabdus innexi TaxID=290109 RepID=A0A1N6MXW8_9GAMM|nr:hypothetical protein XIS1_450015 [Xenorhabdus innexi]
MMDMVSNGDSFVGYLILHPINTIIPLSCRGVELNVVSFSETGPELPGQNRYFHT